MPPKSVSNIKNLLLGSLILLFTVKALGCAATRMYKGEELPNEKIAIIQISGNWAMGISEVDDKEAREELWGIDFASAVLQ